MPIGNLERGKLAQAATLWSAYQKHRETLTPRMVAPAEEIAQKRDAISIEIEKITTERRRAVATREADAALVRDYPRQSGEVQAAIERATKDLSGAKSRLEELRKTEAEGRKRRDQAVAAAAKQEQDMAALMGRDAMGTPRPPGSVTEISPEIRAWAQNFVTLKKEQTIAYFKAESEKFGALMDLRAIGAEIGVCKTRIPELEAQIVRNRDTLDGLRLEKERAEAAAAGQKEAILGIQKRIDAQKAKLEDLAYTEHLQSVLGAEIEAVYAAVRLAQDEVQDGLTRTLGELRAVHHKDFPKKIQGEFAKFEQDWATEGKVIKALKPGRDVSTDLVTLEHAMDGVQAFAERIDTFVSTQLLKAANDARLRALGVIRDAICEEVVDRRNGESGFTIRAVQLIINFDVLKDISALCERALPVVQDHLLDPLEKAAEADYNRVQNEIIKEKLKEELKAAKDEAERLRLEAERLRLEALDAIGNEPAFSTLKPARRTATIAPYKALAKEAATPDIVRAALTSALELQRKPTDARWRTILGLPKKTFFDASPFTDSNGNTHEVHISFFADCLGPAVSSQIGVYKDATTKHTAAEVMKKIFEDGVGETARAHASIEIYNASAKKPHCYLGGLAINFYTVFQDAVAVHDGHDAAWIAKAQAHAETALKDRMDVIEKKVKTWLDNDGAD